ncbi:MAG: hypothetical protein ACYDB7_02245, partial [Mycobacteriales bacterium]
MKVLSRIFTAAALAGVALAPLAGQPTAAAAAPAAALGGFTLESTATPVEVLVTDPAIPLPPPQGQAAVSFTDSTLNTGPVSHALASSVWPGAAVGEGLPAITNSSTEYPVQTVAAYPGGPASSSQNPSGAGMSSTAGPTSAVAHATYSSSPDAQLALGSVASTSGVVLRGGKVIASALATAQDISLIGGIITIKSVHSSLTATSTATSATVSGAATVSGLA